MLGGNAWINGIQKYCENVKKKSGKIRGFLGSWGKNGTLRVKKLNEYNHKMKKKNPLQRFKRDENVSSRRVLPFRRTYAVHRVYVYVYDKLKKKKTRKYR